MLFGMYAPVPHVTVGSKEITRSVQGALGPLPAGEIDPAFTLAKDVLCAADESGFDLCLYAERHLGADFEAWILAAAISSWTKNIRAMPAVHPGLWHPTLIAKMAACLDRLTTGRSAINLVTGWNEVEARMYGGDILLHEDDRYMRAEEFVTVLRGMWNETPFSFDGQFYQVKESQLLLKPATVPEIFTASRSERGLEMVAKYADWWFLDYDKSATDLAGVEDSLRRAMDGMNRARREIRAQGAFRVQSVRRLRRHRRSGARARQETADARRARRRYAQDDVAGRPGDEVGLHRPAAEGARPAHEIHRHGGRAVPAEVRARRWTRCTKSATRSSRRCTAIRDRRGGGGVNSCPGARTRAPRSGTRPEL